MEAVQAGVEPASPWQLHQLRPDGHAADAATPADAGADRAGLHHPQPGQGTAVRAAAPRVRHRARPARRGRPGPGTVDAAQGGPGAAGAAVLLDGALRALTRRVRLVPGGVRLHVRLPVGVLPEAGVPAGQQERAPGRAAPEHAALRRGHGPAARVEPVRRGSALPGPARPGHPRRSAGPRRFPALPAQRAGSVAADLHRAAPRTRPVPARRGAHRHRRCVRPLALHAPGDGAAAARRQAGDGRHRGVELAEPDRRAPVLPGTLVDEVHPVTGVATARGIAEELDAADPLRPLRAEFVCAEPGADLPGRQLARPTARRHAGFPGQGGAGEAEVSRERYAVRSDHGGWRTA